MTVTVASFRQAFSEFASGLYPDATITFNLGFASRLLDQGRWGELYDDGVSFLTAHNLALSQAGTTSGGANVGTPVGVVSSKSVGPISKSIDTNVGLEEGAGLYGATSYGRRYYQMLRMIGAGGVQL